MKIAIIDILGLTYDGATLDKRGLGGSESAVIYMSKELVKLGFEVDVYNNCIDSEARPGIYDGVRFIDHSQIDNSKTYDIIISSRSVFPYFGDTKHKFALKPNSYRVLWMHDTFCDGDQHIEPMIQQGIIDDVFTLSDFHTTYVTTCDHGGKRMQEVIKNNLFQTRNGAYTWFDEVDVTKKDRNHFVYNASVTKGLIPLLELIWPEVKRQIPQAHLTVIGGYYRFREGAEPDEQEKDLIKLTEDPKFNDLDVTFTHVIPQKEIAEILANAGFMIYPSAFPETFGISTLESLLYRTPVITNRFGALEETAVDLACYKVAYPTVPNGLYPTINPHQQAQKFIDQVISAYNDTYLWQQKQYYCDVVKDVSGWDTVALQWKQHFYNRLDKFLPVHEYQRVKRINEKVSRIFGRRFTNLDQTSVYSSSGKQNRLVVVSPFWNAQHYISKCIQSVAQQDYENYIHVLINDASTDNSLEVAKRTISNLPENIKNKFVLLNNKENKGAIQNQLNTIIQYAKDDDYVLLLDGDDWLVNNNTIFHYYNDLFNQGYEFTYGSMWSVVDNIPLIAQDYPNKVKQSKSYRTHKFNWNIPYTHFRTFKKSLINNIKLSAFKNDNKWMMAGADSPLFYELIEQVDPAKIYCNKEIVYAYNDDNPNNDYKIRGEEQNKNADSSFKKKSEKPMTNKTVLIAIPTAKYIEPETFRSLYNLEVPDGIKTHFEYFYGYQIDQIRNLTAEWGKNYDYVFNVDSDIILPRDALKKLISADKPIAGGMYIQRKMNEHTLEVYNEAGNMDLFDFDGKGLTRVKALGFGCCLVKGEVYRGMEYPHFYYQSAINHSDTISEDWYFCDKADKAGFSTWVDPTIWCEHVGSASFNVGRIHTEVPIKSKLERQNEEIRTLYERDLLPKKHQQYIKDLDITPKVIFDIGSAVMHWTRHAHLKWPDADYYLFDEFEEAKFLYEEHPYKYNFGVLTDKDNKEVTFYKDVKNVGGNSYYKENTVHYNESHAVKRIGMTLDTIVNKNKWPLPDLIKLDTQGSELDILNGATKCLENCKDIILESQHTEYNQGAPDLKAVTKWMKKHKFALKTKIQVGQFDGDYHFTRTY